MSKNNKVGVFLSFLAGFFFSGYKTLLGTVANAEVTNFSNSQKSLEGTNMNALPQDLRMSLQDQVEVLKKRFAQENLDNFILGVNKEGRLKIIGTKTQILDMEKTIRELQDKLDAGDHGPSSS